ncbi:MAG: glycine zipper family protein [Bdellovibrionota bacterium]
MYRIFTALFIILIFVGCSAKGARNPQFYPNEKLSQSDPSIVNQDTRHCMSLADDYVKDPEAWKGVAAGTAKSSVLGAAGGAVGGAILSNAGRGTAVGAASGAIVGLILALEKAGEPNPNYEKFVEQCLADKGYRVYAWD